ncbi:MAG: PAS domain S-box protein [Kiloniellaceae bacterium]
MTSGALQRFPRLQRPSGGYFGGIGRRLVVRVLMFSSAVTLVLTVMQLYFDYSRDVGAINNRLDEIGRSYVDSIGQSLWSVDEGQLTLQLQGILRLPHIRAAEVHEAAKIDRPIRIAVGERGTRAIVAREFPITYLVRGSDQLIGSLYVEASLAEVYRSLLDKGLLILASQGAKTFLVTFFILYIFHRLVTRHLADIASSVADYRVGQSGRPLALERQPPERPDELDQVVSAFNGAFAGLQRTYDQLSEANIQLEWDNTALLQAEAALRESERLFRDYTETASDWLWETGPDHAFVYISDEVGAFGLDRSQLIGVHRWELAADLDDEAEKWRAHRAALERHEPFRGFVYKVLGTDGELHHYTISGKPIFDESGQFLGYRGTARDVTVRSTAEARVRELSIAVEESPAGIAIVDLDGRLVYSNRVFLQITGLAETGHQAAMTSVLPDEVWQRLAEAARHGRVEHEEVFARRVSQDSFWGLVSVAEITSSDRNAGRLVVALQDITREKAEQQEREGLLRRLQQTGKMEAIGRLAGGIAHDFNNLLGATIGFSQFLVEDLADGSESRKYAERIVRICEKGKNLVEQLLAFAQARDIERRVLDLAAVLHRCHDLLETSLPSSSALVIEAGVSPLPVLGNEGQIHQVLLNLCLNAKDAFGDRPGTITIKLSRARPDSEVRGKVERSGIGRIEPGRDYALMAVSDTGAGMDPTIQAQIFEPFYTTREFGRGTGLGLAVVHGIVTSYDGAIHVESAPGMGTTFEIYLPLEDAPLSPEAKGAGWQDDVRGQERILVVDDDPDLVQVLTIGLHRYGYEVVSLTDPVKALSIFAEALGQWDLVVSDQVMPGMTGLTLISKLKGLQPALRAILYTGFEEGITESAASLQGADALLHKPISPLELAGHIRRVMANRTPLA